MNLAPQVASSTRYNTGILPEAATEEEQARNAGHVVEEMTWSIRPLLASGHAVADG